MLPWSVIPIAGWPSAAARAMTSGIRAAPSSIENSVCWCRWVNDAPTDGFPSFAGSAFPQGLWTTLWRTTDV